MSDPIRSVSYGGGVQSTALLVLAAQRAIDYDLFIFANTGNDSEHPDTLDYVRDVAGPYAAEHGIEMVEVAHDGPTLWEASVGEGTSFPLPMRGENGAPMSRGCTATWKVRAINRELRRRGATKNNPADVALGISVDEIERAKAPGSVNPRHTAQRRWYPLLDLGLHRHDCQTIIRDAGLPVPRPSSCFFCPFHSLGTWEVQAREEPELFERSVQLERIYKARLKAGGLRDQWMTGRGAKLGKHLDEVVSGDQTALFDYVSDDGCGGVCFT